MKDLLEWIRFWFVPAVKEEPSKCPMCETGMMKWCSCSAYCSLYTCDKCGLGPEDWK